MKIEKISDSQIRCTLSKEDLLDRELRLSELAYGTEKAKALFRDMMQQASYEFGFEADDIPLMIEAIPISSECLVLVITKVEDPDELDTRFSKFSSSNSEADEYTIDNEDDNFQSDLLNCFGQLSDMLEENDTSDSAREDTSSQKPEEKTASKEVHVPTNMNKAFSFTSLDDVIGMSSTVVGIYHGENTLYKDSVNHIYYLVISKESLTPEEFTRTCNMISEYGNPVRSTYATPSFFEEHFETIVKKDAIQILSVM